MTKNSNIIYEWEVPEDCLNITEHGDFPDAYRIEKRDKAVAGIVIFARYNGSPVWIANPWSTRLLITHLLSQIKRKKGGQNYATSEIRS